MEPIRTTKSSRLMKRSWSGQRAGPPTGRSTRIQKRKRRARYETTAGRSAHQGEVPRSQLESYTCPLGTARQSSARPGCQEGASIRSGRRARSDAPYFEGQRQIDRAAASFSERDQIGKQPVGARHACRELPEEHEAGIDEMTLAVLGNEQ